MKSFDVWIDSGVNVQVPDSFDYDSDEGIRVIKDAAIKKFIEMIENNDPFDISFEEYED